MDIKKKKRLMTAGIILCAAVFVFSGVILAREYIDQKEEPKPLKGLQVWLKPTVKTARRRTTRSRMRIKPPLTINIRRYTLKTTILSAGSRFRIPESTTLLCSQRTIRISICTMTLKRRTANSECRSCRKTAMLRPPIT